MKQIRWAVDTRHWDPSDSDFQQALSCINADERSRVSRKRLPEDAKMTLVGQLIISTLFVKEYGCSWKDLIFSRTEGGKPFLKGCLNSDVAFRNVDFNISHHGGWVVLAAAEACQVGVDVMTYEIPGKREISVLDFFASFREQFTQSEWDYICRPADDKIKLRRFIKYWCLKESYVKAIGVGIVMDLTLVEFRGLSESDDDTDQLPNAAIAPAWRFELSDLENDHCVAVALGPNISGNEDLAASPTVSTIPSEDTKFQVMRVEELLAYAEQL